MGGSVKGEFGETKGSKIQEILDGISDALAIASLIPGLDTFIDLASIPIDLARGEYISAGLDLLGAVPFAGEVADTARIARTADKVVDLKKLAKRTGDIAKTSPLKIPKKAVMKVEQKKGYSQIKYTWEKGKFKYTSRWHTRTPNAPINQGDTWVVERKLPGIGYGKNYREPRTDILVGKNKWVSKQEWKKAITARQNGTATKKQKELLDNGHWKAD